MQFLLLKSSCKAPKSLSNLCLVVFRDVRTFKYLCKFFSSSKTLKNIVVANMDCPHGDRDPNCRPSDCADINNRVRCCGTCAREMRPILPMTTPSISAVTDNLLHEVTTGRTTHSNSGFFKTNYALFET